MDASTPEKEGLQATVE